jgi:hypothetical protein
MGGQAHLQKLRPAWKDLYAHQTKKYNFQAEPEGFHFALKELEGAFIMIKNKEIEYINPSVKDFIAGLILNSNEYTLDVVVTARYFGQILRLWELSRRTGFERLPRSLIATGAQLVDAIARCVARPFAQRFEFGGRWAEVEFDIIPEARLRGVITISDDLRSGEVYALTAGCLSEVLSRWDNVIPDFEETVDILTALEEASWDRIRNDKALHEEIRKKMLDNLKHSSQCRDFAYVEEYSKNCQPMFSDEEHEKFSAGFMNYIRKWFHQDVKECGYHIGLLHEIGEFLSEMMTKYGYSVRDQHDYLMEEIGELDEIQEQRAESQLDRWKGNRAFERANSDAIDSMFSSLI